MSKYKVLAIDDELTNLILLEEFLSDTDFELTTAQSATEALNILESGQDFETILLDRMMPEMDGIEFMSIIKANDRFKNIPVIMQTAATSQDEIAEGLQAGVFYYLTKPYKRKVLITIIDSAIKDFSIYQSFHQKMDQMNHALNCLESCCFSFQNLSEINDIVFYLASLYPKGVDVVMGLKELMINAIEHGNLGITYDEKSELNAKGLWLQEIDKRLSLPENQDKFAKAHLLKKQNEIIFTLEDQGSGFNWEKYMEISSERIMHNHGRGIAMSKMLSFDEIEYLPPGNKVVCKNKIS